MVLRFMRCPTQIAVIPVAVGRIKQPNAHVIPHVKKETGVRVELGWTLAKFRRRSERVFVEKNSIPNTSKVG